MLILATLYFCYFRNLGLVGFVGPDEPLETRLQQPVVTMNTGMEAGFYAAVYGSLPFTFGAAPRDQYDLFRIAAPVKTICSTSLSDPTFRSCSWVSN